MKQATAARFAVLEGPWLSVRKSLRAGEWLRRAIMSKAKTLFGADGLPWEISGHNPPSGNNHGHFFYLSEDRRNRGCIDAFFVYCRGGFSKKLALPLKRLTQIHGEKGEKWQIVLENFGSPEDFESFLFGKSPVWQSCSPYLHPWHLKKNFTLFDQIRKECAKRGLPELEDIKLVPYLLKGESRLCPPAFYKIRSKKGLSQPDRRGGFWQLRFKKPVQGPLALGFGCHFGLGLFEAARAPAASAPRKPKREKTDRPKAS